MGILTPSTLITSSVANGLFISRLATSQPITSGVATTVIFGNKIIDSRNQYNPTTGIFTCQIAGYWQFIFFARVTSTSAMSACYYQLVHNNTTTYRVGEVSGATDTKTTVALTGKASLLLAEGDTVRAQIGVNSAGTISLAALANFVTGEFSGCLIARS